MSLTRPLSNKSHAGTRISPLIILCLLAVVVAFFSCNASFLGDDMVYKYAFPGHTTFNSVFDIIPSQISHWHTWNGRFAAHVLVQLFCAFLGPIAFGVANAAMYVLLVLLIMSFIGARMRNIHAMVSVILLIFLCFSTKMLPSCQIGYIWGMVVALAFVKVFFSHRKFSALWWIPLFLFAIFAGNFHEVINCGIGGALAFFVVRDFKKISVAQWILFAGFAIGAILNALSPGTQERAGLSSTSMLPSIIHLFLYALGIYVLIGGVIANIWSNRLTFKQIFQRNSFFFIAAIIAVILNLIISISTSRQVFGISLFCIIIGLNLLRHKALSLPWLILIGIIVGAHFYIQVCNTFAMQRFAADIESELHRAAQTSDYGSPQIFINLYPRSDCRMSFLDDYTENNSFTDGSGNQRKLLYDIYNRFPQLRQCDILPRELLAMDTVTAESGILRYREGCYFLFADSASKKDVKGVVHRTIGIPNTPLVKSYSDVEYSLNEDESNVYHRGRYKVKLISQFDYIPLIQISSVEPVKR